METIGQMVEEGELQSAQLKLKLQSMNKLKIPNGQWKCWSHETQNIGYPGQLMDFLTSFEKANNQSLLCIDPCNKLETVPRDVMKTEPSFNEGPSYNLYIARCTTDPRV